MLCSTPAPDTHSASSPSRSLASSSSRRHCGGSGPHRGPVVGLQKIACTAGPIMHLGPLNLYRSWRYRLPACAGYGARHCQCATAAQLAMLSGPPRSRRVATCTASMVQTINQVLQITRARHAITLPRGGGPRPSGCLCSSMCAPSSTGRGSYGCCCPVYEPLRSQWRTRADGAT